MNLSAKILMFGAVLVVTATSLAAETETTGKLNYAESRALVVSTPMPATPAFDKLPLAVQRRVNGAVKRSVRYEGLFNVQIDPRTGNVTAVMTVQSTGVDVLDRAAVHALQDWQFKPHTLSRATIPLGFALP